MRTASATFVVFALIMTSACAKKEAETNTEPPSTDAAPSEPKPTRLARTEEAEAALTGTPSRDLSSILGATVLQLEHAKNAEHAAALLDNILYSYNIEELRKLAKAEEQAGRHHERDEEELKKLIGKYETLQAKYAAQNSPEFALVAKAWAKVWGLDEAPTEAAKTDLKADQKP